MQTTPPTITTACSERWY